MIFRLTIGSLICLIAGCQSVGSAMLGADSGALDENNALAISSVSAELAQAGDRDSAGDELQQKTRYDAVLVTAA